jgi:SAM-dependent methyltransferase
MFGTFNINIPSFRLFQHKSAIQCGKKKYWYVRMCHRNTGDIRIGWAIRDVDSSQRVNTLEILTKELLPESFKKGEIEITLPKLWRPEKITEWAKNVYWFQTFPFSPKKRADSEMLWNTINDIDWSGQKVLDIGCHYGFMSFKASELGACVTGLDKNKQSLDRASTIQNHIIQQDVTFTTSDPKAEKSYDVVLYLSVHHQVDPSYQNLIKTMEQLKSVARKYVFVELIMPPTFPKKSTMTEDQIDKIVGGTVLCRYRHVVRGHRKVYKVEL